MCASSYTILQDEKVDVYMGWHGGSISIGEINFSVYEGEESCSKEELIEKLVKHTKTEIATMICDLIENANE